MSGGVAYVWNPGGGFEALCNPDMVALEPMVNAEDGAELRRMVEAHLRRTGSAVAERLLSDWRRSLKEFVKVMPTDYKRVLEQRRAAKAAGRRRAASSADDVALA